MTEELKPVHCGCGGEAKVWQPYRYVVICKKCNTKTMDYTTEAEAIMAWNRAMGATAEPERKKGEWIMIPAFENMRCSNCKNVFGDEMYPRNYCPNCGAKMRGEE